MTDTISQIAAQVNTAVAAMHKIRALGAADDYLQLTGAAVSHTHPHAGDTHLASIVAASTRGLDVIAVELGAVLATEARVAALGLPSRPIEGAAAAADGTSVREGRDPRSHDYLSPGTVTAGIAL